MFEIFTCTLAFVCECVCVWKLNFWFICFVFCPKSPPRLFLIQWLWLVTSSHYSVILTCFIIKLLWFCLLIRLLWLTSIQWLWLVTCFIIQWLWLVTCPIIQLLWFMTCLIIQWLWLDLLFTDCDLWLVLSFNDCDLFYYYIFVIYFLARWLGAYLFFIQWLWFVLLFKR